MLSSKFAKPLTRDAWKPQIGPEPSKLNSCLDNTSFNRPYVDNDANNRNCEVTCQTSFISSDPGKTTTDAVQFYKRKQQMKKEFVPVLTSRKRSFLTSNLSM